MQAKFSSCMTRWVAGHSYGLRQDIDLIARRWAALVIVGQETRDPLMEASAAMDGLRLRLGVAIGNCRAGCVTIQLEWKWIAVVEGDEVGFPQLNHLNAKVWEILCSVPVCLFVCLSLCSV